MRIGILQCCSVMPQFQAEFADYDDMFIQLFKAVDPDLVFTVYDLRKNEYPRDLNECHAYITTGSRESTYDKSVPWIPLFKRIIEECYQEKVKLVGICFGHQLIADTLGGQTINSDKGWGIGVSQNKIITQRPWMKPPLSQLNIIVSHQDQVEQLPHNTTVLARSDFCPNYMLQIGENILTVQGHPEFSKGYAKTLMEYRREIIGSETVNAALASLTLTVHEKTLAQWIYNFMFESLLENSTNPD